MVPRVIDPHRPSRFAAEAIEAIEAIEAEAQQPGRQKQTRS